MVPYRSECVHLFSFILFLFLRSDIIWNNLYWSPLNLYSARSYLLLHSEWIFYSSYGALRLHFIYMHLFHTYAYIYMGFPGGSDGKESACNAGDLGSLSGSGRSPGEGNGNPLQYSCLENTTDGGAWQATVDGDTESNTTEQLHYIYIYTHTHIHTHTHTCIYICILFRIPVFWLIFSIRRDIILLESLVL